MSMERLLLSGVWFRRLMLIAFVAMVVGVGWMAYLFSHMEGGADGIATAIACIVLGVAAGTTRDWDRERGLWMLCSFFAAMIMAFAGLWVWAIARDVMTRPAQGWPEAVDAAAAAGPTLMAMWLLATAAFWNWRKFRRSRGGGTAPPPPPEPVPVPAGLCPVLPALSAMARPPREERAVARSA